jgi:transcription-repair coupling factor (superfamily II helicase)
MVFPFVRTILEGAAESASFQRAAAHLTGGAGRIRVSGLVPGAKALHYLLLQQRTQKPFLILVDDNRAGELLQERLQSFAGLLGGGAESIVLLPARDVLPFENLSPHPEIQQARAAALWRIATGAANIAIVPFAASTILLREAEFYASLARRIRKGDLFELEELREYLSLAGYIASETVEMHGEYAIRGGILDVFPPEADEPVRVEFFDIEVESIRTFDAATQRSAGEIEEILLLPFTETPATEETLAAIHAHLAAGRLHGEEEALGEEVRGAGVTTFPGWEFFAPLAGGTHSLFELMPSAAVLVDEPARIFTSYDSWWQRVVETHEASLIGNLARPEDIYLAPEAWHATLAARTGADIEELSLSGEEVLSFDSQPTQRFHGAIPALVEEIRTLTGQGGEVIVAAPSRGEMERLAALFGEYELSFRFGSPTGEKPEPPAVDTAPAATLIHAMLPEGFALPETHLTLFGARDIFDEIDSGVARVKGSARSKTAAFLSDFRDLAIGDFVVHTGYGIGEYQGLKQIAQPDGSMKEMMQLGYAEGVRLYVPLERLDLVQKFRSAEGGAPPLSRIGTQQWAKTKARVKHAMRDMTEELLKLYATRKTAEGFRYSPDNHVMREFEESFEYTETDDQLAAIADIKRDMEGELPMDRLLCGDVGYGKTEVAMRAAFKAVNDGKQVAVLAPTTVLAFQHYETFKQRFANFPVAIAMISRFRSNKQQAEVAENVGAGKVDILIGTHRVLSQDIHFTDLGLVIIDEEQRFGVRHKERLKQLRKEVDVLAMSATPIPRTLHMSLVGLRDMSVIETPPKDRMAINTQVAAWSDKLIRSAIEQELERDGQAYFVHNRVETIYEVAARIQKLVPRARILTGHGQMNQGELEKVMLAFMHHEADVLVSTTIIENGLDIPRCNTMIINRAECHGLSELYQLRGRVGRSNRRAYAYLLVPPNRELTDLARRRLAALKEFSDLGAGFKIAALDLELRGAGNLLGGQQSGHIEAVGFELYTQMLEQTVQELKGEPVTEAADTQLNLGLNIRIPESYIPQENQRLRMYKRIAGVKDEKQLADTRVELRDRYGEPPEEVAHLLLYAALKLSCQRIGVAAIERKGHTVSVRFLPTATVDPERILRLVRQQKGASFSAQHVTLKFAMAPVRPDEILENLRKVLEALAVTPASVS